MPIKMDLAKLKELIGFKPKKAQDFLLRNMKRKTLWFALGTLGRFTW